MPKLKYSVAITDSVVSLAASIPLRGYFPDLMKTASGLGFEAVEINVADPTIYNTKDIVKCLNDNGLACSGGITGMSLKNGNTMIAEDPKKRRIAMDTLKKYVDFMAELKGVVILGTYRDFIPITSDPFKYVEYFKEGVNELVDYAAESNVRVVLEAVNMYYTNYLNSVREMTRFVREINKPNLKVHFDTSHMILHDVDVYSRIIEAGKDLAYVHLSDSDRYACGTGNINFAEYIRGLRDIDYDGYCTVEIVPYPNGVRACEASLRYLKALEECYEIKFVEKPTSDFPRAFV